MKIVMPGTGMTGHPCSRAYSELRRKALGVLSERRSADDAAIRIKTGAVLLELYRDDLPVGPWLNFSEVHGWSPHSQVTLADRAAVSVIPTYWWGLFDAYLESGW